MAHVSALIETDIEAYLDAHQNKSLLRFITCGSVDDGKSTLIGRLLYDSKMIFEDQMAALEADSRRVGTQGGDLDFALLVDGLDAEREQGITIDVAYRFFSTETRKFIVADTPGHEQYTRNMVTGASTADLAVILIDARKGVLVQTRRHSFLVSLLGIRNIVLAVNKMDLVDWSEDRFEAIVAEYRAFAARIGLGEVVAIPISGLRGDNIASPGVHAPWYAGPTLMRHLETVPLDEDAARRGPFRLPVQWVNRPDLDFRGFAGLIASGTIAPGDAVRILPSGRSSTVARIVTKDGDLASAAAGQSITLILADEVDVSRGDVIAAADSPCEAADQFETTLVWMVDERLLPGRPYWLKIGAALASAQVTEIKYKIDVDTLAELAGKTLELNEIAVVNLSLDRPVAFDPYDRNKDLGGFILIDRVSNATVAAGMIRFALRRSQNIHWQALEVTREARAALKHQKAAVLWFTGLSGAGKSTIANILERKLALEGRHTCLLDGDNVRHGLNRDLGFTDADRVENIRRVAEVARLMADAGLIAIVSFISPFRAERAMARALMPAGEFLEIFIDTTLAEAERRDVKGLYKKARAGQLKNFTGIDSPYESPENPEIRINTGEVSPEDAADLILTALRERGFV
jgi:bifunctional enzyme CysN/CysC